MKVIIVTGLSGAGKTQAVNCLEDLGYYCIDNMPPALIKNFIGLTMNDQSSIEKAAFVIDVRGGEFFGAAKKCLEDLKTSGMDYKVIFLEASDEILIRRFNETRRAHPLAGKLSTQDGIEKEKHALRDIRKMADYVIDTSNMKSAQLREEITDIFTLGQDKDSFTINLQSFGYKHGIPLDVDMIFDMRFIPNPFYVTSLKKLTGNSKKVQNYVMKYPETKSFITKVDELINEITPSFAREGKYHLNIAFGCTGGQHRSVTMANVFAEIFKEQGKRITIEYRDL